MGGGEKKSQFHSLHQKKEIKAKSHPSAGEKKNAQNERTIPRVNKASKEGEKGEG